MSSWNGSDLMWDFDDEGFEAPKPKRKTKPKVERTPADEDYENTKKPLSKPKESLEEPLVAMGNTLNLMKNTIYSSIEQLKLDEADDVYCLGKLKKDIEAFEKQFNELRTKAKSIS